MTIVPSAFSHVGVTVPDLPAAMRWYQDVLGMYLLSGPIEVVEDDSEIGRAAASIYGVGFSRFSFAHLCHADGSGLELFHFAHPATRARPENFEFWMTGINHFSVTYPDIEELARKIEAGGGRLRAKPVVLDPVNGYAVAYCQDPWGTVIELCSHPYAQMWS
ncbi:MAG TPA: VOC family protein [Pseudonocardia sp.]